MITRLWLADRDDEATPWMAAMDAPAAAAPVRVATATAFTDLAPDPPWSRMGTAWFTDAEHVARFDEWAGGLTEGSLLAEEVVVRGADWLDQRWVDGGSRLKHVAIARRQDSVPAMEFSERWRAHAGRVGASPIPEVARGQAYVQRHVLGSERRWDAITEVWFADEGALHTRIAWMAEALAAPTDDDLFGEHHLFAVREDVLGR